MTQTEMSAQSLPLISAVPTARTQLQLMSGSGTAGDLLAALLLAWLHRAPDDLQLAVETAVSSLQARRGFAHPPSLCHALLPPYPVADCDPALSFDATHPVGYWLSAET